MSLDLCPEVGGDDVFRFCGIWSKNRWEWMTTLLACMHYKITVVGFYDAMGIPAVEFILNQTEMTTIICSGDYCQKIYNMKKDGMAQHIKSLVIMDEKRSAAEQGKLDEMIAQLAKEYDVTIRRFEEVMEEGKNASSAPEFVEAKPDDYYMFSYTSGTTGDSKGVMLNHNNILSQAWCGLARTNLQRGDAQISYLPYPHSYEQILMANALMLRVRIGYFQGDPLKIAEDCQLL